MDTPTPERWRATPLRIDFLNPQPPVLTMELRLLNYDRAIYIETVELTAVEYGAEGEYLGMLDAVSSAAQRALEAIQQRRAAEAADAAG